MKKTLTVILALVFVLSFAISSYALPDPVNKLYGGFKEIVHSPLDLGTTVMDEMKTPDLKVYAMPFHLIGGIFKGIVNMGYHVGHGVIDVVTFPIK